MIICGRYLMIVVAGASLLVTTLVWLYVITTVYLSYVTGWWFKPLWKKNICQLGLLFPIYGKTKHVPKHQPGYDCSIYVLIMIIVYKDSLSNLSNTGHPSIFSECTFMGHIRLACGLGGPAALKRLKPYWNHGKMVIFHRKTKGKS